MVVIHKHDMNTNVIRGHPQKVAVKSATYQNVNHAYHFISHPMPPCLDIFLMSFSPKEYLSEQKLNVFYQFYKLD